MVARKCDKLNYGHNRLDYTVLQYTAPRILKTGQAVGPIIEGIRTSILACCQSSQSLGRMYYMVLSSMSVKWYTSQS